MPKKLTDTFEAETPPIKGSRFVARLVPMADLDESKPLLARVRGLEKGANHHVWAWRGSDGQERYSDDGEPSGSGGRPVLAHLQGQELVDAFVVVSRHYGGVQLGVGGLVRAYGGAAAAAISVALEQGGIEEIIERSTLLCRLSYSDATIVEGMAQSGELAIEHREFAEGVTFTVSMESDAVQAWLKQIEERSCGRAEVKVVE